MHIKHLDICGEGSVAMMPVSLTFSHLQACSAEKKGKEGDGDELSDVAHN